jgi:hypothetical protein
MLHELFLDWSTTPPHTPDDVLILHPPLSPIDTNMKAIKQNKTNITLW